MPGRISIRGLLIRGVLWLVGLALLGHVLWVNRGAAREVFAHRPDGYHLALAFLLSLAGLVSTFVRWWIMVRALGLPFRLRDAVRIGFVANAVDLIVPAQVGGVVLRAGLLCRGQERKTHAVASVLIDRAVGFLGLFVLAAVMSAINWNASGADVRRLAVATWGAATIGGLGLLTVLNPASYRILERFATRSERLRTIVADLHAMSLAYLHHKGSVVLGLAMATGSFGLYALSFAAVSRALLPHPPGVFQHLAMVPLILFTAVVPLPFGALGLGEEVSNELFQMLGHPSGGLAMLGFRVVSLAVASVSVAVYLVNANEIHPTSVTVETPARVPEPPR